MYRTEFWIMWEKVRVGCFERTASKHVYYLGWNRSPAQAGCMRQVLRPGALGRPRGIGWRGRWEGGSGWGIHVNPWLIHVNVWQKPLQYCKVISLQIIKINGKKNNSFTQLVCTIAHKLNTFPFIFFFPLGKQIDTEKLRPWFQKSRLLAYINWEKHKWREMTPFSLGMVKHLLLVWLSQKMTKNNNI